MQAEPASEDPETARRLDELTSEHGLSGEARARLAALLEALASAPYAPTTIRTPERAVDVHVADSLAALKLPSVRSARVIADIGAGAGFPGLPLAAALPDAVVYLLDGSIRKVDVIRLLARQAGIGNAEEVPARAESWTDGGGRCDVVTARAVASLPVLLEYGAPLLRIGGAIVAWKGRRDPLEERAAAAAARDLGLRLEPVLAVQPFEAARDRHLYIARKEEETPARFPRRPGVAARRPLGAG